MEEGVDDSSYFDYMTVVLNTKSLRANRTQELISNLVNIAWYFEDNQHMVANLFQESHLDVSTLIRCYGS